ncbi:NADH-quinone oxidoreductase subunit NuoE [Aliiglaciecola sp. CAU 1673]|uniref:NADH-quinone oxidoreductase subunit NuoE n=1 Tax=Aliiglaciecola sp. CAU 1673 TaxID=3032595 RepID=UPI0023DC171B|nr:NADH-quinone oxidoreductase subunit NuoE [Aliiglaciecola sp. CAU 1673]MDF2176650.1 NADH-quinone oxidoreductase subunit NuoE [Aliiglaciecola sp. CAU 1673]
MNQSIPIRTLHESLTEAEREAVEAACSHYEQRPAAAIDALMIVQQQRGWVDDERLYALAELLGMSATELEGVATFYNHIYRQPVGRHVIHLCNSISCWLQDVGALEQHLCERLSIRMGQTSQTGQITLLPNVCLGCCDKAPAMMLDGELIMDLDKDKLDSILDKLQGEGNG